MSLKCRGIPLGMSYRQATIPRRVCGSIQSLITGTLRNTKVLCSRTSHNNSCTVTLIRQWILRTITNMHPRKSYGKLHLFTSLPRSPSLAISVQRPAQDMHKAQSIIVPLEGQREVCLRGNPYLPDRRLQAPSNRFLLLVQIALMY